MVDWEAFVLEFPSFQSFPKECGNVQGLARAIQEEVCDNPLEVLGFWLSQCSGNAFVSEATSVAKLM